MELFEGRSRETQMDANKKKETNEAFIAEWQKHKYLWYVKQEDIKMAMLENLGGII